MIKKGLVLSFITAVISGVSIFSNSIFVSKTDPLVFTLIRNSVVVIFLTGICFFSGQLQTIRKFSIKDWGILVAIGAIGGGIPFALFFTGLAQIGPVNGNIIQKTLFIWVALLAVPFLHERINKIQILGYFSLLIGMFALGGTSSVVVKTGTWLVLGATMLWAIEHVIAKKALSHIHPFIVSWGRMLFGLPFLLLATLVMGKFGLVTKPTSYAFMPILMSSILLTGYVSVWYSAIKYAPVTLVSSVLVLAPVVTAILSSSFLGKAIGSSQQMSYLAIVFGVLCVSQIGTMWRASKTLVQSTIHS